MHDYYRDCEEIMSNNEFYLGICEKCNKVTALKDGICAECKDAVPDIIKEIFGENIKEKPDGI